MYILGIFSTLGKEGCHGRTKGNKLMFPRLLPSTGRVTKNG